MSLCTAIFTFWLSAHAQPYQAQALTQQAWAESRCQACPPDHGTGRFLYQWAGVRANALSAFARTYGCPPLQIQLRFAMVELREPWFSCFWRAPPALAYATLRRTFGRGGRCW